MFQERFKDASRRRVSKGVSGAQGFEGFKGFKGVSRNFQGCFKKVSCMFHRSFEEVFQENIQGCKKGDIQVFKNSTSYPDILELKISICMSKYFRGVYSKFHGYFKDD